MKTAEEIKSLQAKLNKVDEIVDKLTEDIFTLVSVDNTVKYRKVKFGECEFLKYEVFKIKEGLEKLGFKVKLTEEFSSKYVEHFFKLEITW